MDLAKIPSSEAAEVIPGLIEADPSPGAGDWFP